MKKIRIYIIVLFILLVVVVGVYYYFSSRPEPTEEPTATPVPTVSIPADEIDTFGPTLTQDEKDQMESDREFGKWTKELYVTYPWYDKLPLRTDKYFVYFDIYEKKFIADIYPVGEQDIVKNTVLSALRNIGVDITKYEIVWTIR